MLSGLYGVISPQGMYELSYKLGNDIIGDGRRSAASWMMRVGGSVMFLVRFGMSVLAAIAR